MSDFARLPAKRRHKEIAGMADHKVGNFLQKASKSFKEAERDVISAMKEESDNDDPDDKGLPIGGDGDDDLAATLKIEGGKSKKFGCGGQEGVIVLDSATAEKVAAAEP